MKNFPLPFKLFVYSAIGFVLLTALTACDEPTRMERFEASVNRTGAPPDATNIVILDDEWYTFEWRGQCFLASNDFGATTGTGLLARVECE